MYKYMLIPYIRSQARSVHCQTTVSSERIEQEDREQERGYSDDCDSEPGDEEEDESSNSQERYDDMEEENLVQSDDESTEEGVIGPFYDSEERDTVESLLLDENIVPDDNREPLYPGATITICAAFCAIMLFAIKNKLSFTAIENLIKLLHLLCPPSSKLPSSL